MTTRIFLAEPLGVLLDVGHLCVEVGVSPQTAGLTDAPEPGIRLDRDDAPRIPEVVPERVRVDVYDFHPINK
jgi:hypothetical protein